MKNISILTILILILSCKNNRRSEKEIIQLCSLPIDFPSELEIVWNGNDTIMVKYAKEIKLVVYTNAEGCMT